MKRYFLIDILTVVPIGLMDDIIPNSMWYCTTLNMMKILRTRNIIVYSRRLRDVSIFGNSDRNEASDGYSDPAISGIPAELSIKQNPGDVHY